MFQFDFKTEYVLENDVVRLCRLERSDYDVLLEYAVNEPDIWKFNAPGAGSPEKMRNYIDSAVKHWERELNYPFIVFDKASNKYAGCTRFYDILHERKTLMLGYTWYGKSYQGTALNKNCKYLLLEFAFDQWGMERVGFGANSKNERSINAMKSIGCVVEGTMRSSGYDGDGQRIDSTILSIIKPEWEGGVKERLKNKIDTFAHR